jgi:release factor glutamine methyltransferase
MNLQQIKTIFSDRLSTVYSPCEVEPIFSLICGHLLNYSKIDIHTKKEIALNAEVESEILSILERLLLHEPIQYILGTVEFLNVNLTVDKRVLIPRQETELLVDIILKEVQGKDELKIIDLCTGSGCIAIALAFNLKNALVSATDLSKEALILAQKNANHNKCTIHFMNDSLLKPKNKYETYDIVVSNPPYVRESEKEKMEKNVIDFEPPMALFVSDSDPLIFYETIADFGRKYLSRKGAIYCEINEVFGREIEEIFKGSGFKNTHVLKDLNNKDRFIKASRK